MTIETANLLNNVDLDAVAALTATVGDNPSAGKTTWAADVAWQGGFCSTASIRDFGDLRSDEPPALGGTNSAPNPVEQLLAALGNCLAVGYAANASARGIEVRDLRIRVTGDLDLHSFLGLRPGHAGFDSIRAEVHLEADASPNQIAGLHEAVTASSPVGHTLQSAIPVAIELA